MKGLEPGSGTAAAANASAESELGSVATNSRHAVLKAATRTAHAALDGFTMQAGFFESASRFGIYLERMAHFHRAYAAVTKSSDVFGWRGKWLVDRHAGWIAEDLHALGQRASPATLSASGGPNADATAHALSTLAPKSASRLLGSLYVLAGSTLGARMLHKLTVTRALPAAGGSSYLAHVGGSINWQQFLVFLESTAIDSEDRMIEGALATFCGVQRSLELGA